MSKYYDDQGRKLYEVGACDPAGTPWTVATLPRDEAVRKANELFAWNKAHKGNQAYFITDPDDPEKGDVWGRLEDEMLEEGWEANNG
jgi:hypothetical protein